MFGIFWTFSVEIFFKTLVIEQYNRVIFCIKRKTIPMHFRKTANIIAFAATNSTYTYIKAFSFNMTEKQTQTMKNIFDASLSVTLLQLHHFFSAFQMPPLSWWSQLQHFLTMVGNYHQWIQICSFRQAASGLYRESDG